MENNILKHVDLLVERYPSLESCKQEIISAYQLLEEAYSDGRKLLVAGNGGSASDSEHIVGELMKEFKLKRKIFCTAAAAELSVMLYKPVEKVSRCFGLCKTFQRIGVLLTISRIITGRRIFKLRRIKVFIYLRYIAPCKLIQIVTYFLSRLSQF